MLTVLETQVKKIIQIEKNLKSFINVVKKNNLTKIITHVSIRTIICTDIKQLITGKREILTIINLQTEKFSFPDIKVLHYNCNTSTSILMKDLVI